jgi:hypothetical protein
MDAQHDYFGERVAATYDDTAHIFEPGAVEPAADLLAELADGGRALEPFTSESRQHVSVWEKRPA